MQQFVVNSSNGENNQCNTDMQNLFKNIMENVTLTQNVPIQDNNQYLNRPYFIQIPVNNFNTQAQYMMSLQTGQPVYVNQPIAFPQNDAGIHYNFPQVVPMAPNFFQVDVNDLSKNMITNNQAIPVNSRSRKKSYNTQVKSESDIVVDQNGEQLFDTKNRPLLYSCSECSRKFSMQSRLTQHKKCHSNTRPYQCKVCGFAFTQKSYLVRHAAVHKEERPYECGLCKKNYKHYGSLANHRKTHKNGTNIPDGQISNENSLIIENNNLKAENDNVDMNNNQTSSTYEEVANEFLYQNQVNPIQNFSQYSSDNPAVHFSTTFPNILSTNQEADSSNGFLNQLNSQFYSIIPDNSTSTENLKVEKNTSDINNSSISGEFPSQPVVSHSSPISTYAI